MDKHVFEIQVTVTGDGHSQEVESYLTRSLRSLGDVQLVGKRPFIHLYISVMDLKSSPEVNVGSIISSVVTYPFQDSQIDFIIGSGTWKEVVCPCGGTTKDPLDGQKRDDLEEAERYETTVVSYATPGKLKDTCEQLVTKLDILYLKPSRDAWMEMKAEPKKR
jgi:hypothetical protein